MTTYDQSQQSDLFQTELESMSSPEASHAKTSQLVERKQALRESAVDYGQSAPDFLGSFDLDTPSLKTLQTCLLETGEIGLSEFSGTFPRSGMMRSGTVYQLPNLARTITEIASGLSATHDQSFYWRTPDIGGGGTPKAILEGKTHRDSGQPIQIRLADQVKLWPTPCAHEARLGYQRRDTGKKGTQKSLTTLVIDSQGGREQTVGSLNPTWVEWLMGFPLGHTDLNA